MEKENGKSKIEQEWKKLGDMLKRVPLSRPDVWWIGLIVSLLSDSTPFVARYGMGKGILCHMGVALATELGAFVIGNGASLVAKTLLGRESVGFFGFCGVIAGGCIGYNGLVDWIHAPAVVARTPDQNIIVVPQVETPKEHSERRPLPPGLSKRNGVYEVVPTCA